LRKARIKTLAKIPYVTEDKAKTLKQNAKVNPGLKAKAIEIIISDSVQHIRMSKRNIEDQISDLEQHLPSDQVEILVSFIGIDKFSAIGLLIEIGNIDWFELSKRLVAYIGVHPVYGLSGDGTYGTFMSKSGRTEAKRILYMVTMSALKSNNDIRCYYLKKLLQGKKPMVALGACMHKTLRTIFAMLKNKTKFSSTITDTQIKDLEEKLDKIKKKPNINIFRELENKRFYQDFDSTAPISAFQHKKRKDYRSYIDGKN
jgi:transposase